MDTWSIQKTGYNKEETAADGNRFLCANGYMGLRGTVEEAGSEAFPAITLAGVYDRYKDRWREPVNAPNALSVQLIFNGRPLSAAGEIKAHKMRLDYRCGIRSRETDFGPVQLRSEWFASLASCHLLADRLEITAAEEGELEIRAGISTDIWDINGPHLFDFRFVVNEALLCRCVTGQTGIPVAAAQSMANDMGPEGSFSLTDKGIFRIWRKNVTAGEKFTLCVFAGIYTGLDTDDPARDAQALCVSAKAQGYEACLQKHRDAWEKVWQQSEVMLEGDEKASLALHASQYHLNCIAPRHAGNMSIPARGLSGQTYKGAIFWDSEIFFFPMFVYTQPEAARSLLVYRIETLPGALRKAEEYGYRGAFYAWESQEGGTEGCTNFNVVDVFTHRPVRTYFRDKQIHISGDIAYALRSYYDITGDRSLLEQGGARVILECARFYISRASGHLDSEDIDFTDVIGPDEYHERVTNNAFTNRIILHTLQSALLLKDIFSDRSEWFEALLKELDYEQDWALLKKLCAHIRAPQRRDGVIEQFDGYFGLEDCSLDTVRSRLCDKREYWGGDHGVAGTTQIIKQADVIAMMALFPNEFSDEEVAANWHYYEPRTEHGSSLSACMYALTACRIGEMDAAWDLFIRTAMIDIEGGGKQWAGEIYIGGTHPASNGGAWMIAALGFAGLRMKNGVPELHPNLPPQISRLAFPITSNGRRMLVKITQTDMHISEV